MPIYEFKCTKCEEFFEVIVMGSDDKDIGCPKCKSDEFERVVSKTNFSMGVPASQKSQGVQTQERTCSTGSCKFFVMYWKIL